MKKIGIALWQKLTYLYVNKSKAAWKQQSYKVGACLGTLAAAPAIALSLVLNKESFLGKHFRKVCTFKQIIMTEIFKFVSNNLYFNS